MSMAYLNLNSSKYSVALVGCLPRPYNTNHLPVAFQLCDWHVTGAQLLSDSCCSEVGKMGP